MSGDWGLHRNDAIFSCRAFINFRLEIGSGFVNICTAKRYHQNAVQKFLRNCILLSTNDFEYKLSKILPNCTITLSVLA